jgi:hypothetical protein
LDLLNRGSTLNVGNFIIFRITGRDAREMAMQFDNTPPEGAPRLESVPYRTGRPDVYRTAGDMIIKAGNSRSYGDVANETANYLTNSPNYHAYCKFIEDGQLAEHHLRTNRIKQEPDPAIADRIRENSRRLARPRSEVEREALRVWTTPNVAPEYSNGDERSPRRTNGRVGTNPQTTE